MPEVRIDSVWHSWWIGLESQRTYKRPHNGREQNGSLLSRNQVFYGPVTQSGECNPCKVEVESSNLSGSTIGDVIFGIYNISLCS